MIALEALRDWWFRRWILAEVRRRQGRYRLTPWQRVGCWRRRWLCRIAWLWRRLPGCRCDPDGYALRDMPEPICGAFWRMSVDEKVAAGFPRTLAEGLADVDACDSCGHETACHPAAALRAAGGEGR